jgi:hypothetical protein
VLGFDILRLCVRLAAFSLANMASASRSVTSWAMFTDVDRAADAAQMR